MQWLTKSAVQARLLVVSIASILLFIGVAQLRNAPVDVYPEFSPVYVEVQTEALGLSAEEVEQILTVALEQDLLNGIAFLDEIWSESMNGLSRVVCVFEPGTDPMKARQVVAERLTQAHALPNVSKPPIMLQPYSSTSRVLKIGLSPATADLSLVDLSVLARWTIQPYLMGVEGVANVSIWGQRKRQMQVQVDPENLKEKGVKLGEVIKTTGEALWVSPLTFLESSTPGTGGFFDTPNQRLGVRHVLPINEPEDLANVALHGHENTVLGDVTTVVENHQPLIGDAIVNGQSGLMLVVEKFPWANTIDVTRNVETALSQIKPGLKGIHFDTDIFRPANFAKASFANLSNGFVIALLLGVAALFFFFYEWRAALIGSLSVVLSLLIATYILNLMGTTFNMMVLAGLVLALGLVANDTIAVIDNMRRRLGQRHDLVGQPHTTASIIVEAVSEMRSSLLFATCAILLAILPLYFLGGLSEKFLTPLATSFLVALATSLVVAVTLVPALGSMLYANKTMDYRVGPVLSSLQSSLGSAAARMMQSPVVAYAMFGILALATVLLYPTLNKNLTPPDLQANNLVVEVDAAEGTSLVRMNQLLKASMADLSKISGVSNVAAHIGRAVMSDKVENVNSGEIWINLDEKAEYTTALNAIQKAMENHKDLSAKVQNYYKQSLGKSVRLSNHLYAMRVYGENQEMLTKKAEEVKDAITGISGIVDPRVDYPPLESILEVEVDLEKARQHEIKPGDVRRAAATLIAGVEVGSLFEGQKVFDVVVWGTPDIRDNIDDVGNLLIEKPGGGYIRLGEVADVKNIPAPRVINREAVCQYIDVPFHFSGSDHSALVDDIDNRLSTVDFPLEYHAELTGSFQQMHSTKSKFYQILLAVLIGMLLLFQAAFVNWRLAFFFLVGLLACLSGGLVVAFLIGNELSLGVLAGLLAVAALAIHLGTRFIRHLKRLELRDDVVFGEGLVERGMEERFAPMMMTILTTALVLLPFAVMGSIPGLELVRPMAIVLLGGLATTLLFQLFVLPRLYLQFGRNSESAIAEEKAMLELSGENLQAAMKTAR